MKIFVKTLKGISFEVEVKPEDKVSDVKKNIETVKGVDVYPASQQMLIHQGKVLVDTTTLDENKITENSFVVIMLSKKKSSPGETLTATAPTTTQAPLTGSGHPASTAAPTTPQAPAANMASPPAVSAPAPVVTSQKVVIKSLGDKQGPDIYGEAASTLVAGNKFEETIQQILDMGGGTWDRDTVTRALRAAHNNPERAVDYLYSGIPEQPELPRATQPSLGGQAGNPPVQAPQPAQPVPSSGPNSNPLDLFPQGLPNLGSNAGAGAGAGAGSLDFLLNNPQFQALRAMVQANPHILQPMLQELGRQNPQLVNLIQEHQADFANLMNEPIEGLENAVGQFAAGGPQQVAVTPEELEAIERLEAMGYDREIVLEVFFACNKNEELAANYLIDHGHEFQ